MSVHPSKVLLFKRSNGFYYILYTMDGRKRWKSTHSTLKSDALRALTDLQQLLRAKPKTVTVESFVGEFLDFATATFSRRTVIIYKQSLRHFQKIVGNRALTSLTQRHLDIYKSDRLKSIAPVSVNIELRALKAAMATAVRWRFLDANPFTGVTQARVTEHPPVFLTKDDLGKLLAVVDEPWLRELIVIAVATGMRQAEILNLRWQDIDLSRNVIHIQSNATFRTKQGKRRTIPMSDLVHAMFISKAEGSNPEFVFSRKGRMIGESYLTHRFKKYLRLAGLKEELHWHSLRHTHATWLVQAGVSIYEVQKLLGHSSITMTQVYAHLPPSELHSTVEKLTPLLQG